MFKAMMDFKALLRLNLTSAWRREGWQKTSQMLINILRMGVKRMAPGSFQWCPVTGQGAMGTNWSRASSRWTWRRTSSLWGWLSIGTGCPGRLWSLLLWRYSRPTWTRSCAAWFRWPCFGRRVGLDDPQRSFPTPNILWFCDFVITLKAVMITVWGNQRHISKSGREERSLKVKSTPEWQVWNSYVAYLTRELKFILGLKQHKYCVGALHLSNWIVFLTDLQVATDDEVMCLSFIA